MSLVRFASFELLVAYVASLELFFEDDSAARLVFAGIITLLVFVWGKNTTLLREEQLCIRFVLLRHCREYSQSSQAHHPNRRKGRRAILGASAFEGFIRINNPFIAGLLSPQSRRRSLPLVRRVAVV